MSFAITPTLVDLESKVRFDVESMARINLSDLDFILEIAETQKDERHKKMLYEVAVNKVASSFQLAMKACEYLKAESYKQGLIKNFCKKSHKSNLGVVCSLRDSLFHDGQRIFESELFYPLGKIKGRGYVGIYVAKGGRLNVDGIHIFEANKSEFAITSDGVFEVLDAGSESEKWQLMKIFPTIEVTDLSAIVLVIKGAVLELKKIWFELKAIRINGDGQHEYSYLNEEGSMELFDKGNYEITAYSINGLSIKIENYLTITPPDGVSIAKNSLTYFAHSKDI
jgi:hypothetical protein